MNNNKGKMLLLNTVSKACLLALGLGVSALYAEEAANDADSAKKDKKEEVMLIVGVRQSERQSLEDKRNATSFVDVINASDIGELPERGIAEALEQLPGVAGNRDRGRTNTLAIRGLGGGFTLTTINGREIASSFGSRSVNLNLYPSEAIRKAFVRKTGLASQIEGGVGGSVDLMTLRPLNIGSDIYSFALRSSKTPRAKDGIDGDDSGYRLSGMFSKKMMNNTLGVAVGISALSDPQMNHRFAVGDYTTNKDYDGDGFGDPAPGFMSAVPQSRVEERQSLFASVQWRPTDDWDIVFDLLNSNFEFENQTSTLAYGALHAGPVTAEDSIISDNLDVVGAERLRSKLRRTDAISTNKDEAQNYGLNATWTSDVWTIEGDVALSKTQRQFDTINSSALKTSNTVVNYDFLGDVIPNITLDGGDLDLSDPTVFRFQFANDNRARGEDKLFSTRLDFSRDVDFGHFNLLKFGTRFASRTKTADKDEERYQLTFPNQFFLTDDMVTSFPYSNVFSSFDSNIPNSWYYLDPNTGLALASEALGGLPERTISLKDAQASFETDEDTVSIYAQLDFETKFGDMPFRGNFGVRIVDTDLTSTGSRASFTLVDNDNDGVPDTADFDAGSLVPYVAEGSYRNVLPSFNAILDINDDLLLRMAAGIAIKRPEFTDLAASLSLSDIDDLNEPVGTGSGGNPTLKPIQSDQVDIALEWYPSKGTFVSTGVFYKTFDSIYGPGIVTQEVEGLTFDLQSTVQDEEGGKIQGYEFNFKKELNSLPGILKWTGISGNYTKMDIDVFVDYNLNDEVENLLYPEGAVDTMWNTSVFYDDGTFSAKVNLSSQSEQIQENGGAFFIKRPSKLLSASLKYNINDSFSVLFQGSNLTDEDSVFGQIGKNEDHSSINRLRLVDTSGARYYIGIRAKF